MANGINLKPREIEAAFDTDAMRALYAPIMTVPHVAALLQLSKKTIYHWIQRGRLDGTFRKRGKHHLFWRDRVIDKVFNGPEWESDADENEETT
jgi:excisionase family DNA binding protein